MCGVTFAGTLMLYIMKRSLASSGRVEEKLQPSTMIREINGLVGDVLIGREQKRKIA